MTLFRIMLGLLLLAKAREHFFEHFRKKVRFTRCATIKSPCWVWTGYGDGRYGHIWFLGERFKVHRFVFFAFRGYLLRHQIVDRECNRAACCSPHHIIAATQSQNIKRCFDVGRGKSQYLRSVT